MKKQYILIGFLLLIAITISCNINCDMFPQLCEPIPPAPVVTPASPVNIQPVQRVVTPVWAEQLKELLKIQE